MQEDKEEHPKQKGKKHEHEEPDDPGSREQHSMSGSHRPHPPVVMPHSLLVSAFFLGRMILGHAVVIHTSDRAHIREQRAISDSRRQQIPAVQMPRLVSVARPLCHDIMRR